MSFRQMELALNAPVTNAQFRVLMILAHHAHDDGTNARPGLARLVARTGMSERSVQEALLGLRTATPERPAMIEPVAHEHGGRGRATEYRLLLETPQLAAPIETRKAAPIPVAKGAVSRKRRPQRVQIAAANGAVSRSERVREIAVNGAESCTPIRHEPVIEHVSEPETNPSASPVPSGDTEPPPPVPDALLTFDTELRKAPGYAPTVAFYERVLSKYAQLDLYEEGLAIAEWLSRPKQRREKRTASPATIYNWLKRSAERQPPLRANGYSATGVNNGRVNGKYVPVLSPRQATAEDLKRDENHPNVWTDERARREGGMPPFTAGKIPYWKEYEDKWKK